ncbi:ComEC family competence protein, partial [Sphingomonas sp. AOB5]|nr:ComEC family competence protein [Sphingomonas sp. AOB5]
MGSPTLISQCRDALERWLEREREQLVLWLPVMFGAGITVWFVLPERDGWIAFLIGAGALAAIGLAISGHGRFGRIVLVAALAMGIGCGWIWWRAERVAAPVLARAAVVAFDARVARVEQLPARGLV